MGATCSARVILYILRRFQFTLPRGERLRTNISLSEASLFQFTLPRGERRTRHCKGMHKLNVSIHAPARGATLRCYRGRPQGKSFNSRSREGSDSSSGVGRYSSSCFNSRSREGSDLCLLCMCGYIIKFQFTLPRGERHPSGDTCRKGQAFQFTLPRGERREYGW